ncbi:hypothetical protein Y032_0558g3434 [Ancylostoma ceylanicum]|uniref:Uncharacterized protein n=1 Tax=Ancylostoma ceylanicum TaxID=53326 RepID=A0A016WQ17_9BILA|nr:hypothetical protein Y032_0558g3434 [Ancylostoma ceylanicum]
MRKPFNFSRNSVAPTLKNEIILKVLFDTQNAPQNMSMLDFYLSDNEYNYPGFFLFSRNEGTAVPAEINLRQKRAGGMWWRHDMDKYKTKQPKNA